IEKIGYEYCGEFNIPLHWGFAKRGSIDFNLHVYHEGNPEVELNLVFRDMLRAHPNYVEEYSALKHQLLDNPSSYQTNRYSFAQYTLKKGLFIKKILNKAEFTKSRLLFCAADEEWKEYHRIKKECFFDPINIKYDPHHASMSDSNHYHFILYGGTTIVAAAHVQFLENNDAVLKNLTVDRPFQEEKYDFHMLEKIETWLRANLKETLFSYAKKRSLKFYKMNDFIKTIKPNFPIIPTTILMKKNLNDTD
ncbi:GrpB family protein, partial [Candidatus Babeliales bacterium]|nr:GrpB family protein [Candidatus Babeliales bacterium]